MRIGIPTEIKNGEYRVAIMPAGVDALAAHGHTVLVQAGAGLGAGVGDEDFAAAGAVIVPDAADVWHDAELVTKVKEPVAAEYGYLREDLALFAYLHLAADRPLTEALCAAGTTAIAYETVQAGDRSLPLLTPMSEIAGRLSVIVGAQTLMRPAGGRGTLLGGVAGVPRAEVVVIGGGVAGENAIVNALGLGAGVTVIDVSLPRLRELERRYGTALQTRVSSRYEIAEQVKHADLVVGAVLVPGAAAPRLVADDMVAAMKPGSVLVDIAIDQGGCFEGSRPTTHDSPTFAVHDSLYYCVANMPGAVPVTSTRALTGATLPYLLALADRGVDGALHADPALAAGLNTRAGVVTNPAVAAALGLPAAG